MRSSDRELEDLADKIRDLWKSEHETFVQKRTGRKGTFTHTLRYDGGRAADGKRYENVWLKIAAYCLEKNFEYDRLIRAIFDQHKYQTPPQPNNAYNKLAEQRYRKAAEESPYDVFNEIQIQLNEFERALFMARALLGDTPEAVHYVLANRAISLSALFRYCIACREGLGDIAALWKLEARRQYFRAKAKYDHAWGDCIPAQLFKDSDDGR